MANNKKITDCLSIFQHKKGIYFNKNKHSMICFNIFLILYRIIKRFNSVKSQRLRYFVFFLIRILNKICLYLNLNGGNFGRCIRIY